MSRSILMFIMCAVATGSAHSDPITGIQSWEFMGADIIWSGPPTFGSLPEPEKVIQEVAMRSDHYVVPMGSGSYILPLVTPEYTGGPAPMSDVFFTVNLSYAEMNTAGVWAITATYEGDNTLLIGYQGQYLFGIELFVQTIAIRTEEPISALEESPANSIGSQLRVAPNPLQWASHFKYQIDAATAADPVTIRVIDANGRCVRSLLESHQAPGQHTTTWDGCDAFGVPVANGVYYLQLRNGSVHKQGTVTVMR